MSAYFCILLTITGALRVDDVLDNLGFGKFQWTISVITGLAWVRNLGFKKKSRTSRLLFRQCFTVCAASAGAGWRRHGDCYPEHLVLAAALRVEAEELSGGCHVIGRKTGSTGTSVKVGGRHHFSFCSQIVFLAIGIGNAVWGIFCDKYGRRIVSVTLVLVHGFFLHVFMF